MGGLFFAIGTLLLLVGIVGVIIGKLPKITGRKVPVLLLFVGIGFIIAAGTTVPSQEEVNKQQQIEQQLKKEQQELLAKINVKADVQDMVNSKGERKIVLWIENNSDKTFTGSITVKSLDVDGSMLSWDVVYPENLQPGKKTFAILWFKVWPGGSIQYDISKAEFK